MSTSTRRWVRLHVPLLVVLILAYPGSVPFVIAQQPPVVRQFPIGAPQSLDQLRAGRLRSRIEQLPAAAQERALRWLSSFQFTEDDLSSLHADDNGGIYYVCEAELGSAVKEEGAPLSAGAESVALPISPFPASLVFHSRPGAPNVLFINFSGETVTNTEWNNAVERAEIPALPFSSDSDYTTFSDAEQVAIKRIWQRVAEDYAPFNVDVTTERPGTLGSRTAHALITGKTDANGDPNPYNTGAGVAYVNVFGSSSYAKYRPAWIYHDNLYHNESYVSEAASHEIGHNLGLSHDGKTDGAEYYGGHGSGDISWGPLMGTGYHRNVSQWCKGDYDLANNDQDDLATIAGKASYRTDDHGNTPGTATFLQLSGGTNVVSTTPENDPANLNTANKGVIERPTDIDVFSFVTGHGPVQLAVNPWIMPSGTRGGNLDVLLELYNETGTLLQTANPATQTTALIQVDLPEGRYYLHVRGSGAGDPFSSTPTGYTVYGSLGQYFISGFVTESMGVVVAPIAELQVADVTQSDQTMQQFSVVYSDDLAVDVSTIDHGDIRVSGPNGYDQAARFVSLDVSGDGTPRRATYRVDPTAADTWSPGDNGTYTVWMQAEQVGDTEGAWVAAGQLGQFNVSVPSALYFASMDVDPGWTLEPQWQYGTPSYGGIGPTSGYTGTRIIGYHLSGNYANNLPTVYAITPPIDTSGSSALTLRFRRWLGLQSNDSASIQASMDGVNWVNVWVSSGAISDSSWQEVQYALPSSVAAGSSLQLRWAISSNPALNNIGWNLDDVEVLGDGTIDTTAPAATLTVADLVLGGSPSHSCSVTYTDDTAVRLWSLDSTDLLVTGPNGYSNLVEFVGADLPTDGSPMTGTYSIPAPGGTWDGADNGTYMVTLLANAVEDTLGNATSQATLGGFNVSITMATVGVLDVSPVEMLSSSGNVGGPFSPSSMVYTLANTGETTLDWSAGKSQNWLSLSATSGTLAAGESTTVTVSINGYAESLTAGSYSDIVDFVDGTTGSGNTTRTLGLTIYTPGKLEVSPSDGMNSSGYPGGPFTPSSRTYTLLNNGETALDWTLGSTAAWLDCSASDGTLAAGSSTIVTVLINQEAETLAEGTYNDTLSFANSFDASHTQLLSVTLRVAAPLEFILHSLSSDGTFSMVVEAIAGTDVVIEASSDLANWTAFSTNQVAADGTVTFSDLSNTGARQRFYRARTNP